MINLLQIFCSCCGSVFYICKACYRGHKYCGNDCRKAGYLHAHRKAQETYRSTDKGRRKHRDAETRRRWRKKNEGGEEPKLLDCARKTCICLAMKIKELHRNIDLAKGICNCLICGAQFVINESCIEIVEPQAD